VVLTASEAKPNAVLFDAVVLLSKEHLPTATYYYYLPVLLPKVATEPTAVFTTTCSICVVKQVLTNNCCVII
jgi:hypothetical protein